MGLLKKSSITILLIICGINYGEINFPFQGIVTGDNVNVRSGPDINYYPVVRLMKGNKVQVVGEESGWFKIVPPKGTFSLISKDAVEKTEEGKAKVIKDKALIRAGSKFTKKHRAIQVLIPKGTELTIIGQTDGFYKIIPPRGAYLWISAKYVKPLPKKKIKKAPKLSIPVKPTPPTTQPAKAATTQTRKISSTQPTTTQPATETVELAEESENLFGKFAPTMDKLEKQYKEELKKPLLARDFSKLAEEYKKLSNQSENLIVAAYARQRLAIIQYQIDAQKGAMELRELLKKVERGSKRAEEKIAEIELKQTKPPVIYQAEGILKPSSIFRGPLMPKRYRLVNPKENRTIAYVELASKDINIAEYIGKYVGVYGKVKYDPKLRINIIKATTFKIISRNVPK